MTDQPFDPQHGNPIAPRALSVALRGAFSLTRRLTAFLLPLLALLLCACSGPIGTGGTDKTGNATPRVIQVRETTGAVTILPQKKTKELAAVPGMNLALADTLATGMDARATLDIDQDKSLDVAASVRMRIEALLGQAGADAQTRLQLDAGKIYVRIRQKLAPEEAFEIATPTCTMGVRGTQFYLEVDGSSVVLVVLDGTVLATPTLKPQDGQSPGAPITLQANEWIRLENGIPVTETLSPQPVTQNVLDLLVLEAIRKEPAGIAPALLENLEDAIQRRKAEAIPSTAGEAAAPNPAPNPASGDAAVTTAAVAGTTASTAAGGPTDDIKTPAEREAAMEKALATGGQLPFATVNRTSFARISLRDPLDKLKEYLGEPVEDNPFVTPGHKGYGWTETVGTVTGRIYVSVDEQGLVTDKIEQSLEAGNPDVAIGDSIGKITKDMTLAEIDQALATPHYEFKRVLTDNGDTQVFYGWYSMKGGYRSYIVTEVNGALQIP